MTWVASLAPGGVCGASPGWYARRQGLRGLQGKEARNPSYVSWHQDLTYWGLDCDDLVTVWVALSPASEESGCMRVLPGSHRQELLPHEDIYDPDNMLTRGQEISIHVDEQAAVAMALEAGQMSLHNVRLAHASGPNRSGDRRIGVSL